MNTQDIEFRYSKEIEYLKKVKNYKKAWDSYNGEIPKPKSLQASIDFLSSFTKELKKSTLLLSSFPEFFLAPDGILGFEWDYGKNSNLFARIYKHNKIEYILTENNKKQALKETNIENLIKIGKEKFQS